MVNLTQKIKTLALQNNIPYQDCTAKLTEYFVFNNWFNDTPKVINKELYISDETWNNNENEIVSYFSSFSKTPEQKHERLVQMFEKEFPETFEYFNRFKKEVTVDRSSVVGVLDFMLYYLPGEIAFSSNTEIKYLLNDASEHLKRCDAEVLVFFINWLSESRSIRTAFNGLYQVNNYSKAKNNEAYDLNFYLNVLYHMLNADYISKNQMYLKAAKSKDYIDTWLFISLHFLCALRTTDLLRFPHPKLAYSPEEVLEKVKKGEFTDEDAKRTLLSINVYLNAVQLTPNKTKDYSGISTIHFHVPSSLEVHVGTLFAIAEAHFQLSGADESQPLLRVIREYRDIKKAMGDEIANLFIKSNFHCRQANKSFLQMIEYLTRDVIASNNDFNVKGYELASRARSHKGSFTEFANTTRVYLQDQKMSGYTADFVAHELLERGVLSNIATMLLKMLYKDKFEELGVENQTKLIKELSMSPLEIENSIGVMQRATNQSRQTAIEIINAANKQEILVILHRIGNDEALSKTEGSLCIMSAMKKQCPFKEKSTCIGCQYEVSTKTTVFQLAQMSLDLKSQYDKANTQIEKDRLKTIVTQTILPKLQDVLLCIKENYGDTEFSIMNNLVKELTANEQQQRQQQQ